jgi:hypothetical protein
MTQKISLSFDVSEIELLERQVPDAKGKTSTWVNFNLAPIVAPLIVEIAKANGYYIPTSGLSWSCQKKNYQGLGAGFVKAAKPQEEGAAPSKGGAGQKALESRLAAMEETNRKLMEMLATMAPSAKQEAPVGTTITRRKKAS